MAAFTVHEYPTVIAGEPRLTCQQLTTIAFAALVNAMPQHSNHLAKAHVARSNMIFARTDDAAPLAGRTVSFDGSCGSWSGYTCSAGNCCSSEGWCGNSSAYCAAGCQSGFGLCGPEAGAADVTPAVVSTSAAATAPAAPSSTGEAEPLKAGPPQPTGNAWTGAPQYSLASEPPSTTPVYTAPTTPATTSSPLSVPPTTSSTPVYVPPPATSVAPSPTSAQPASSAASSPGSSSTGLGDTYTVYLGDGTTGSGWPSQSEWVDFDTAFENNLKILSSSCAQWNVPDNSDDENNNMKSAIQSVASSTGVDARFILAIVMQESNGCVRAPTTNYGVTNPGLMQSHDGAGTCNSGAGAAQSPCPMQEITQMITDGAGGTPAGDGLKQTLSQAASSDVSQFYKAARIYNSGSVASDGKLEDGIATHCYASDVANRLTGWVTAPHGCTLS